MQGGLESDDEESDEENEIESEADEKEEAHEEEEQELLEQVPVNLLRKIFHAAQKGYLKLTVDLLYDILDNLSPN